MLEYEAQDKSIRGRVMIDVEHIAGETAKEYNIRQRAQRNTLITALKSHGQPYEYSPAFSAQLSAENQKLDQEVLEAGPDNDTSIVRNKYEIWSESNEIADEEHATREAVWAAELKASRATREKISEELKNIGEYHAARQRTL